MSGIEIFGAVAAAIGLTSGLFKAFGTRKNAPRQVDRLRKMLDELTDHRLIDAAEEPERARIAEMVNRCTDLLQEHGPDGRNAGGGGGVGVGRRGSLLPWNFHWPADVEEMLKVQNDEMDQELTRLTARVYRPGRSVPSSPVLIGAHHSPTSPTDSRPGAVGFALPGPRRGSGDFVDLIATLCLQQEDGELVLGPLPLHRVNILERDEETRTRTILYESLNSRGVPVMRVTHRIPRGTIRFEDEDLSDLSVSFLDPHDITVQNSEGYKVYRLHTVYDFRQQSAKEEFLCKMRERDLLGSFYCVQIKHRGDVIAQSKVVRLWVKTSLSLVTFAFLTRGGKQCEMKLGDFDRKPVVEKKKVKIFDQGEGGWLAFELRSGDEAAALNEAFESYHPATWNTARMSAQTPTSWLSTPELGGMTPSSSLVGSSATSFTTTSGSSTYSNKNRSTYF